MPCWDLAPRVTQPVPLFWGTKSWIHNEAPEAYLRAALPFLQ